MTFLTNKKFIIASCVAIIVLIGGLVWYVRSTYNNPQSTVTPTPTLDFTVPTPTTGPGDIIINDLPVDNFYENAPEVNKYDDAVIEETSQYRIVYLKEFEQFKITILDPNITEAQQAAEKAFLQKIGLEKVHACRLNVEVYIANYLDSAYAGQIYPLSFCSDSK